MAKKAETKNLTLAALLTIVYEVSFPRHFYQPQPLRSREEISADVLAIEKEAEGLLDGLLKGGTHS